MLVPHVELGSRPVRSCGSPPESGCGTPPPNSYRLPSNNPSATQGGGASGLPNAPAFYNVAFRFNEPMPDVQSPNAVSDPAWWRENAQAHALTSGDISQFFANVDFNKLAAAGRRRHARTAGRGAADRAR